jgi:hypothetical protein
VDSQAKHEQIGIDNHRHAADYEQPVVDPCRSEAHRHHDAHERDTACEGHVTGGIDRIIEQFLQHWRGQSQGRQQDEADREEHDKVQTR